MSLRIVAKFSLLPIISYLGSACVESNDHCDSIGIQGTVATPSDINQILWADFVSTLNTNCSRNGISGDTLIVGRQQDGKGHFEFCLPSSSPFNSGVIDMSDYSLFQLNWLSAYQDDCRIESDLTRPLGGSFNINDSCSDFEQTKQNGFKIDATLHVKISCFNASQRLDTIELRGYAPVDLPSTPE